MLWGLTYSELAIAACTFVGSTLVTTGIVVWFLIGIRPDYFVAHSRGLTLRIRSPIARAFYTIGKNLLGTVLILVGVVLSLPGVPGQGLLTIFVGILLLDVPRKRALELRLVRRDAVRRNVDRVRARFGKPPLELDVHDAPHPDAPHQPPPSDMPNS